MSKSLEERIAELEEAVLAYGETLERHRVALRMIREAVEAHAPPGSLPSLEATGVTPVEEAEAIVAAIQKIAG